MIFERVFCNASEKKIFKFNSVEIFPNVYIDKSLLQGNLELVTRVITSPTQFEDGVKFYNLKQVLWKESKTPLIIKSGEYFEENEEIKTSVEIYCLEKDLELVKKKAGL
jgi:hypothetical protein